MGLFLSQKIMFMYFIFDQINNYYSEGLININIEQRHPNENEITWFSMYKSLNCFFHNLFPSNYLINIHSYTLIKLSYYLLLIIVGELFLITTKMSYLCKPFFFYILIMFKSYIYKDLCLPLFFLQYGDKYILRFDSNQEIQSINLLWLVGIILILSLKYSYYIKYRKINDLTATIICPKYLKFSFSVIYEILNLLLTLGAVILNFIFSNTKESADLNIGILYIFMLLSIYVVITFLMRPYQFQVFNSILLISLQFPLAFCMIAMSQSNYKNTINGENIVSYLVIITIIWICLSLAFLIGIVIYFFTNKDKFNVILNEEYQNTHLNGKIN
jgi:hypothetical protein